MHIQLPIRFNVSISTPSADSLVRGVQSHVDVLAGCSWGVLLGPALRPRSRKSIDHPINVRTTELANISEVGVDMSYVLTYPWYGVSLLRVLAIISIFSRGCSDSM